VCRKIRVNAEHIRWIKVWKSIEEWAEVLPKTAGNPFDEMVGPGSTMQTMLYDDISQIRDKPGLSVLFPWVAGPQGLP
jgi:hypothetical protein